MKKLLLSLSLPFLALSTITPTYSQEVNSREITTPINRPIKIQVAILLDTSSSMDGLINQAKSRLWNIVNTLSTLKYHGQDPQLEIALYEYGNSNLSVKSDYIRQVTGFTTDLDLLSELLFALKTNGGSEYCGTVIQRSLSELIWSPHSQSLKLIYIAGNESFDQGEVNYMHAINHVLKRSISMHTIYCGDRQAGINELWYNAAQEAGGKYFNINTQREIQYRNTPYDDRITLLNQQLNDTYIGYGRRGMEYKEKQINQDANASYMDKTVMTERTLTKSSSKYSNANWDVVDAYVQDKEFVKNVKESEWSEEFKNLTPQQREKKIIELQNKRNKIQKEIQSLAKEREKYLASQAPEDTKDDLGYAITESILELAASLKYTQ